MAAYTDEDYRDLDSKAYYAKDNSKYTKKGYEFENKSTVNQFVKRLPRSVTKQIQAA